MKIVKILLWILFVVGVVVSVVDSTSGIALISFSVAILLGLAINQMLTNIRAIKENSDEILEIAKKNAAKE